MTCRELIDFLDAYLDGELAASVLKDFEHHLSICSHCRAYLEQYRGTVAITQALGKEANCEKLGVPEELVQAVLAARRRMV